MGKSWLAYTLRCAHSLTRVTAHDVLAITLRAVVYYLGKNVGAYHKLCSEISEADERGELSQPVRYVEAAKLSYLYAISPMAVVYFKELG